ncbi:hypothetical protein BGZ76_007630, partial [Entomortierella beljakovae]
MKHTIASLAAMLLALGSSKISIDANTSLSLNKLPVDVTLFVMSRCPDAVKCEGVFSEVFSSQSLPPVNPALSFIGLIENSTIESVSSIHIDESTGSFISTKSITKKTTVTCKHGPLECAGNTQQLCFKEYFPDHKVWIPFVVTMNSLEPHRIGELQYAKEVAEKILSEGLGSIDNHLLDKVSSCADSQEGFNLLVNSVQNTIDHGVTTSCTVFIDNRKRCVVDGGEWRECPEGSSVADFIRSITEAASRLTRV